MGLNFLRGDVRLTRANAILLGMNTAGGVEVNPLEALLRDRYPVFFSEHRRMGRGGAFSGGALWFFRDAQPWLVGAMLRDATNSIIRLRHLEQAMITLRRDWQQERLTSLAIAPLGDELEWLTLKDILQTYLETIPIPVWVYEEHLLDVQAEEPSDPTKT